MKITDIQYVRNGSGCCEGFTQVFFSDGRKFRNMMAIAFGSFDDNFAVINLDNPMVKYDASGFRSQIQDAIATWYDTFDHTTGSYTQQFPFEVK